MPQKSAEQLKTLTDALKTKLAAKGASLEAAKVRKLKKQIRRAQRRRRALDARAKKRAGAPAPAAE